MTKQGKIARLVEAARSVYRFVSPAYCPCGGETATRLRHKNGCPVSRLATAFAALTPAEVALADGALSGAGIGRCTETTHHHDGENPTCDCQMRAAGRDV